MSNSEKGDLNNHWFKISHYIPINNTIKNEPNILLNDTPNINNIIDVIINPIKE